MPPCLAAGGPSEPDDALGIARIVQLREQQGWLSSQFPRHELHRRNPCPTEYNRQYGRALKTDEPADRRHRLLEISSAIISVRRVR
jgi:hypothetical protein